nr:iap-5 [Cnaphalocrocis medinalis granulovirus]
MDIYENRLASFEHWTGEENVEMLASIGFYYTGYADMIMCYYCKFDSYNYTLGNEDTIRDHKRYSPYCFFNLSSINQKNNNRYVSTRFVSPRTIKTNFTQLTPFKNGDYTLLEHRLNSFINYPQCLKCLVGDLCDSGFYYTNIGDAVCCYACKVVLKNFTPDTNVSRQHKQSNPDCPLLHVRSIVNFMPNKSNNNNDNANTTLNNNPSAPKYHDGHYVLPKCLKCKIKTVNCALLPCFHLCACHECALTMTQCEACDVFVGGFFVVNFPINKFNLIEHEQLSIT